MFAQVLDYDLLEKAKNKQGNKKGQPRTENGAVLPFEMKGIDIQYCSHIFFWHNNLNISLLAFLAWGYFNRTSGHVGADGPQTKQVWS